MAWATSPTYQRLHKTRLHLENNPTNPSPQETSPELLLAPIALLDRPTRSISENATQEAPRNSSSLSWGNPIPLAIMSWLSPAAAFIKPLINAATKSHHTKELTRVEREAPIED